MRTTLPDDLPNVLITNAPPPDDYEPLHDVANVRLGRPVGEPLLSRDEVLEILPTLDGLINQGELTVDRNLLEAAPRLKIIANVAIGTNNLDLDAMRQHGVIATNAPDAFTDATADAAFALLLALARNIPDADRFVRNGHWPEAGFQPGMWDGMELRGKTLGIIGFGKIGRALADRAEAFGMNVLVHSRSAAHEPRFRALDELMASCDVISLHVPLTDDTRHLIDQAQLKRMRSSAFLINLARGPVVDEAALVEALQAGELAGAALDVFEDEPNVHPDLLTMDNVVLTPHLGGGTRDSRRRARRLCADNVARVVQGRPPLNEVT